MAGQGTDRGSRHRRPRRPDRRVHRARTGCCCRPSREDNPNYEQLRGEPARLAAAGIDVTELPLLPYAEVAGETVAAGYLNFYICNGAVIVPVAGADTDEQALAIIAAAYPGREVVPVPGARARLRRRRAALHHPAGAGARWPEPRSC